MRHLYGEPCLPGCGPEEARRIHGFTASHRLVWITSAKAYASWVEGDRIYVPAGPPVGEGLSRILIFEPKGEE